LTKELRDYATLKGTIQGLKLILNDQCSFSELLNGLEETLSGKKELFVSKRNEPLHAVVDTGYRFLTEKQQEELRVFLSRTFHIEAVEISSHLMKKKEAERAIEEVRITKLLRVIRYGQEVEIEGDVLLIGDVDPGGEIRSTGSIYVFGSLRGRAAAGTGGEERSVICAAFLDPSELEIAGTVKTFSEEETEDASETIGMFESALLNEDGNLVTEKVQNLRMSRPDFDEGPKQPEPSRKWT
jgi:septum site-determining protein MinC